MESIMPWSEIITFVVTVAVAWGVMQTKIKNIEAEVSEIKERLDGLNKDHDLLVELNTKVDMLLANKRTK